MKLAIATALALSAAHLARSLPLVRHTSYSSDADYGVLVARMTSLSESKLASSAADLVDVNGIDAAKDTSADLKGVSSLTATGVIRTDYMKQLLLRGFGEREKIDRIALAKIQKELPRRAWGWRKRLDERQLGTASQEDEAEVDGRYLTWKEVDKLKKMHSSLVYNRSRPLKPRGRKTDEKRASVKPLAVVRTPLSSASRKVERVTQGPPLELPGWGYGKPRAPRQRPRRLSNNTPSAAISNLSNVDTISPASQQRWSVKKFRGNISNAKTADAGSPSVQGSSSHRDSPSNSASSTSSDPPLVDNRRLPPGSRYAAPTMTSHSSPRTVTSTKLN